MLSKHAHLIPSLRAILLGVERHSVLVLSESVASDLLPLLDGVVLKIELFLQSDICEFQLLGFPLVPAEGGRVSGLFDR